MDAKALLKFKPTVIQTMDAEAFDRKLLNAHFGLPSLQLPSTICTWNQLHQWYAQHSSDVAGTATQLRILQAMQFNSLLVTQEAEFYFDQLVKFHDMRDLSGLGELKTHVVDKSVTLRQICTAIRAHYGSEAINKSVSWVEIALDLDFVNDIVPDVATYVRGVYDYYQSPFMEHLTHANLDWNHRTSPAAKDHISDNSWEVIVSGHDDIAVQQATLSLHATYVALHSMVPAPLRIPVAQFHNIEYPKTSNTITIHKTVDLTAAFCADKLPVKTLRKKLVITASDPTKVGEIKQYISIHKTTNEGLILQTASSSQAAQQSLQTHEA